jgi:hypothetical protein
MAGGWRMKQSITNSISLWIASVECIGLMTHQSGIDSLWQPSHGSPRTPLINVVCGNCQGPSVDRVSLCEPFQFAAMKIGGDQFQTSITR